MGDAREAAPPGPDARAKALVALSALSVALLAALVWVLAAHRPAAPDDRPGFPQAPRDAARLDPEVRRAAIAELVSRGAGIWDSHPDPDVGRLMQRELPTREHVRSNEWGLRERSFPLAKPPGVVRVVLLGDSFVYGHGCAVEDRLGTRLEAFLEQRTGVDPERVEVLSFGISSWNVVAEASFLRRQLSLLRPDLVVQLVFNNDLDDVLGVRGFGARSAFAPRVRQRAGGVVARDAPSRTTPHAIHNPLLLALDHESRRRYAEAADAILELDRAVEAVGGRYLLVAMWLFYMPMVKTHLAPDLAPEKLAFVSEAFLKDRSTWIHPRNNHWNRAGNERVAKLLYGLAHRRQLLPALELPAWDAATEEIGALHERGEREADDPAGLDWLFEWREIASSIDFDRLTPFGAGQLYGGIDGEGRIAPYASLVLAAEGGTHLRVRAERLDRPELRDARVRVWVEEHEVGAVRLRSDTLPADERFELPDDLRGREYLNVRFESEDWVYTGDTLETCVGLRLVSVAVG